MDIKYGISEDPIERLYDCELKKVISHKNIPFHFKSAKNIDKVDMEGTVSHKLHLGLFL